MAFIGILIHKTTLKYIRISLNKIFNENENLRYFLYRVFLSWSRGSIGNNRSTSKVEVRYAYIVPSPDPIWWDYTGMLSLKMKNYPLKKKWSSHSPSKWPFRERKKEKESEFWGSSGQKSFEKKFLKVFSWWSQFSFTLF